MHKDFGKNKNVVFGYSPDEHTLEILTAISLNAFWVMRRNLQKIDYRAWCVLHQAKRHWHSVVQCITAKSGKQKWSNYSKEAKCKSIPTLQIYVRFRFLVLYVMQTYTFLAETDTCSERLRLFLFQFCLIPSNRTSEFRKKRIKGPPSSMPSSSSSYNENGTNNAAKR